MTEGEALSEVGARLTMRELGPETLDDFRRLMTSPPHGWCWCVAWETPTWEGWVDRSEEQNRLFREELWRAGFYDGRVFYLEGAPIAWCRVGPRRSWPKLCQTFELDPSKEIYAFVCFGIVEPHRRHGWLHHALELVLEDLAARGVPQVEAFPRGLDPLAEMPPGEAWMGPPRLFERAGFRTLRELKGARHMVLDLATRRAGNAP